MEIIPPIEIHRVGAFRGSNPLIWEAGVFRGVPGSDARIQPLTVKAAKTVLKLDFFELVCLSREYPGMARQAHVWPEID